MAEPVNRPGGKVLWVQGEKITETDLECIGGIATQGLTSLISRLFRDAVLDLAGEFAFARRIVNSGRLSVQPRCTARR